MGGRQYGEKGVDEVWGEGDKGSVGRRGKAVWGEGSGVRRQVRVK